MTQFTEAEKIAREVIGPFFGTDTTIKIAMIEALASAITSAPVSDGWRTE